MQAKYGDYLAPLYNDETNKVRYIKHRSRTCNDASLLKTTFLFISQVWTELRRSATTFESFLNVFQVKY